MRISIKTESFILPALKLLIGIMIFKNLLAVLIPKEIFAGLIFLLIFSLYFISYKKYCFAPVLEILLFLFIAFSSISSFIFPFNGWRISYYLVSVLQILVLLFSIRIVSKLSSNQLNKIEPYLKKILFSTIILGFIEFFIPNQIKYLLLSYYNLYVVGNFSIPVAYYLGDSDISVLRIGSIFFEPLTFSFISGLFFLYLFERKEHWSIIIFALIVHLMTMGKLPIFCTMLSILFFVLRRFSYSMVVLVPIFVFLFFIFVFNDRSESMPSMANHVNGLFYGLIGASNSPILGNGIGTAGFLIAIASANIYPNPFAGNNPIFNGNESAVGILSFQYGIVFIIFFILVIFLSILRNIKIKNYLFAGYTLGVLIAFFLTESILGVVVFFFYCLFGMLLNERSKIFYY